MALRIPRKLCKPSVQATCVAVSHFVLSLILLQNHEMWYDELHPWVVATRSDSLPELLAYSRYDGHPALWYLCVWLISLSCSSPSAMQFFHVGIASAAVFVFVRSSPFTFRQKVLFTLGYYSFYEYCSLARNYGIEVLLIFIACTLWRNRKQHYFHLGLVLLLLSNTNVFGMFIAVTLAAGLIFEQALGRLHTAYSTEQVGLGSVITLCALVGLGIVMSLSQMIPPADGAYSSNWYFGFYPDRLYSLLINLRNAYLAVPGPSPVFWHINLFQYRSWLEAPSMTLSLLCMGAVGGIVRKKTVPLLVFAVSNFLMFFFFYVKYLGSPRHHGQLFIVFVTTLWLASFYKEDSSRTIAFPGERSRERALSLILTAILAIHTVGGVKAQIHESSLVFSAARDTAAYLTAQGLDKAPLVGYPDFAIAAILGYLDKQDVFYPQGHRFGSFVRWDTTRLQNVSTQDVVCSARRLAHLKQTDVVLVLNYELPEDIRVEAGTTALQTFKGMPLLHEDYYLYLVPPSLPLAPQGSAFSVCSVCTGTTGQAIRTSLSGVDPQTRGMLAAYHQTYSTADIPVFD